MNMYNTEWVTQGDVAGNWDTGDALDGDKCTLVQKKRGLQSNKGPARAMWELMRVPGDYKTPT